MTAYDYSLVGHVAFLVQLCEVLLIRYQSNIGCGNQEKGRGRQCDLCRYCACTTSCICYDRKSSCWSTARQCSLFDAWLFMTHTCRQDVLQLCYAPVALGCLLYGTRFSAGFVVQYTNIHISIFMTMHCSWSSRYDYTCTYNQIGSTAYYTYVGLVSISFYAILGLQPTTLTLLKPDNNVCTSHINVEFTCIYG